MRKTPRHVRVFLFQRLTALLKSKESCQEIPAMAFLVEVSLMADGAFLECL